ncbi:MAG: hypothetical protein ACXVB0_09810 [Mucilaginibacter sp.]
MKRAVISLTIWLFVSLYFGVGGIISINLNEVAKQKEQANQTDNVSVEYNGITFKNKAELSKYLNIQIDEKISKVFFWVDDLTDFGALIVTACFFGMLGGVINVINDISINNKNPDDLHYFSLPITGFLSGIVILGLTYLIPTLLVQKSDNIRSISLMFLCLFGGIKSKELYSKIDSYFNKIFK